MSHFKILSRLRRENGNFVLCDDVYKVWIETLSSEFRRILDTWSSVVQYVQSSKNLALFFSSRSPPQLSSVTKLGAQITHNYKISEVLIDSTFKTNSERMKIFVVILSYIGVGFPLAYMLLKTSNDGAESLTKSAITKFLKTLARYCPKLRLTFFSSEKDRGKSNIIKKGV